MKNNKIILIAFLNILVAITKLISGIIFSFSTLVFDSIQSFIDFFTDITSLIANKIGKRRANKTYPFGYGQVYYLSNLLTGILLFGIGVFILYQVFAFKNEFIPNIKILFILIIVLIIKTIVIFMLQQYGKTSKNEYLIESYKESKADLISTCVVIIVLILSFFEKYIPSYISVDKIGSTCMALYVFSISIKMIILNIKGILTNDQDNDNVKDEIISELKQFGNFKIKNIRVIKMSYYFHIFIQIDVNNNIKIKDYLKIEKKIKNHLKSKNKLFKFIDIEPM